MEMTYHTVLSIAGSDSIGGAGIQADIKTCSALGVYAMTAITAITAQNTLGVRSFRAVEPDIFAAQLEAIAADVTPDAVKIGMIPDAATAHITAEAIRKYRWHNIVIDPVMVATSGDALSSDSAYHTICSELYPLADVFTPNIPEAEKLTGLKITNPDDMSLAAHKAAALCQPSTAVLLKGGHLEETKNMTDLFLDSDGKEYPLTHPRVDTLNTHGTGCSLSSAIAALLARRLSRKDAVTMAAIWVSEAIQYGAGFRFGHGHGPINHIFKQQV